MINLRISIFIICLSTVHLANAQVDSLRVYKEINKINLRKTISAPIILGGAGLLAISDIDIIGRADLYEERNEKFSTFRSHADDYMQYAPIAGVVALNGLGIKGQHDFATQMWLLTKSELLMMTFVFPLKKFTSVPRPDTGMPNSFPSGHTAQAFVAATFMHKEYGKQNPLYSVLAYGTATSVGVLRMMNNRHWSTDVLVGAGIGILSTNLVYFFHDQKRLRRSKIMAVPTYQDKNIGINAIISLN
ncbi:MAG: phosphatase PAP2 family protein [Cyclobacteriaceae bacterium]|nr:phosphatase PAP2 family protein [Cyclobacteriaceae bacterium]